MGKKITLVPVIMRVPSKDCIYTPSRWQRKKRISEQEFIEKYADYGRIIKVSFNRDGISNPQEVTAYGRGLDCWWIRQ